MNRVNFKLYLLFRSLLFPFYSKLVRIIPDFFNLNQFPMKKITLLIVSAFLFINVQGQVFNTGQTLKRGTFSLGVNPTLHMDGGADGFILFAHAGYGIKSGLDISAKFGLGDPTYFGADLEFALGNRVSLAVGAHNFHNFGLDGTLNFVIPIKNDIRIYTGLDADLDFFETTNTQGDKETELLTPLWFPIGLDIGLTRSMSMIFEAEIAITDEAYHIFGGGLNFYF